ncbi:MAG: ferric reductase-like transmembrane domain-containing protein [Hyphomicrobiaceae bacterium]|nr:ferric reductase-like transmembrane domain-containing protein [Hyphomicrobiaceae bacterium]
MKPIKLAFAALVLTLTGLWLLADTITPSPFTYFSFRSVLVQVTGIVGIGVMSIATVLAARPRWLEPHLGGLDKMYRLHKWLGIAALVFGLVHWWWAKGTKWMVGWGWLARPERPAQQIDYGLVEGWLRTQRGFAEFVGEWAFYAIVVLIALALWKRFPYRWFAKTHRWISVAYLILVYHAIVLVEFDYWAQPVGWVTAVLLAAGAAAALIALFRRIGADRKVEGVIESTIYYPELRVLETAVRIKDGTWTGHSAGQFSFVTSEKNEGAHPFTIASAWDPNERRIVFITKALGDYTEKLHEELEAGMPVTVEGPYGCFNFRGEHPVQVWIGAGIGVTPFIARMKQLAGSPDPREIVLFHPTKDFDQTAIDKLTADAKAANVRLHVLVDARDGFLDGDRIRAAVPNWLQASIWFCGPPRFGQALSADFAANGFPASDFHQELFEMR